MIQPVVPALMTDAVQARVERYAYARLAGCQRVHAVSKKAIEDAIVDAAEIPRG